MRPLVSVVVPMYKCEPYLRKCLDSLVNQTLKEIEIICVNDGSPDNSAKIAQEYQKKDDRIILINQKNKGVAEARNTGMKKVHSPYLMWCDPDDFYDLDMCEKMYHAIVDNDVDVVCCEMKVTYEADENKKKSDDKYYTLKFKGKRVVSEKDIFLTDSSLCNKIFKISFIQKNLIRFPEGLIYEDACFLFKYLAISQSIFYLPEKLYNYIRHENSIMNKTFKKTPKAIDHVKIMKDIYCFFKKRNLLQKWKKEFLILYLSYFNSCVNNLPLNQINKAYQTAWPMMKKFSAQDIAVLPFWQQEKWRHILRLCYNQKGKNEGRQEAEYMVSIKQTPKFEWEKLFKQYTLAPENIYKIYAEEILESNILTDTNDWFYLTWICLLLQKKEAKKAAQTLAKYVAGINRLKHIEQFLPVANLAEKKGYTNDRIHKAALVFRALEKNKKNFKKLIHGKTVAVVGNGPSEIGKGKGPEIDSHDIVIRMNNYRTEGFEADYGSKTDIWIRGWGADDLLDYTEKNQYLFAGITGNYYLIPLFFDSQLDILYRDLIENKINTGYISCDLYSQLTKLVKIEPTTGFATLYAVKNLGAKKLDLYGFSFQQQKVDGYATHYFNDRDEKEARERSQSHSWDQESEWIKKLLN